MEYIKDELNKLVPISLLIIAVTLPHWQYGLIGLGLFLLMEHRLVYARWDVKDILGHETFGIILLVFGLLSLGLIVQATLAMIIYLIFGKWKWLPKLSPIKYALNKLKWKKKK